MSSLKQTAKLELVPLDWKVIRLAEIVSKFIVPMRDKPKVFEGDIPWCRIEDFTGIYLYKSKSGRAVSRETIKSMNLKVYPIGTVLVSCSADLGRCAITAEELVTNQTFIGLYPNINTDNVYLYYKMLQSADRLNALSSGTTISYLSREQFENFVITVPSSRLEQQKIAGILSSVDEKIEVIDAQLNQIKELKKGLMQQLLTKGIGHTQFKNSVLGDIPDNWEVRNVQDFAKVTTGSKDTQNKVAGGLYPFIVRSQKVERINSYAFEGEAVLTAGDGVGVGKVFHYLNCKFDYHQRVYNIHNFNTGVLGKYFYEYFKFNFNKQVRKYNAKGSVDSVRMDMITKMLIPIPPINEQQKIVEILSTVNEKLDLLLLKKESYQELKKGLMQQLLTGKIRVNIYQKESAVA